jgi:hypothetical protein
MSQHYDIPVVTNTTCSASLGAINITVSGGTSPYTYLWSNGATTEDLTDLQQEPIPSPSLMQMDVLPICRSQWEVTMLILQQHLLLPNTTCTSSIGAISLIVSGGTAPYTYLWNNGATTPNINGLAAGTYTSPSLMLMDVLPICLSQ